jgi:uncharacterized membrane protein
MHPASASQFMVPPVSLGLLYIGLGIPLARGKVRPNSWYGFRVAKTLNDEAIWYKVNAFSGRAFLCCGAATVVLALAIAGGGGVVAMSRGVLEVLSLAIVMVPLAATVVASSIVCYRA